MMLLHRNGCILSCTCEVYVTRTCAEARHVKWISTCSNLRHMKRRVKLGRLFALFLIIALIRLLLFVSPRGGRERDVGLYQKDSDATQTEGVKPK